MLGHKVVADILSSKIVIKVILGGPGNERNIIRVTKFLCMVGKHSPRFLGKFYGPQYQPPISIPVYFDI